MHPDAVPRCMLDIELAVGGRAYIVFSQQLNLPVPDTGIFELDAGHYGLSHLPACPLVALKIGISHRPQPAAKKRPAADQFDAPVSRAPPEVLGGNGARCILLRRTLSATRIPGRTV